MQQLVVAGLFTLVKVVPIFPHAVVVTDPAAVHSLCKMTQTAADNQRKQFTSFSLDIQLLLS